MPDLDELLAADRGTVVRAAADAAHLPDFSGVAARGRRRRNVRNGAALGVAGLATVALLGTVQLVGEDPELAPAGPDTPSPSAPQSARDDEKEARDDGQLGEHIVDDEQSVPIEVAASGDDVRATLWQNEDGIALCIVDDAGDGTRAVDGAAVPAGTTLWPAPGERFVVVAGGDPDLMSIRYRDGRGVLVDATDVEGPVADGEVVVAVGTRFGEYGAYAVDVDAATAHPVDLPVDDPFRVDVFGDRIVLQQSVGNTAEVVVHWSDDGVGWRSASTTAGTRHLVVPSSHGEPILLESADGADPAPLDAVHTLAGETFERAEYTGDLPAYLSVPWDQPAEVGFVHGEQVRVVAARYGVGEGAPREAGLFAWTGSDLEHLESGAPEFTDDESPGVVSVAFEDGEPVLWISGADGTLLRSDDGGASFDPHEGR